jgi:hypothetical protein
LIILEINLVLQVNAIETLGVIQLFCALTLARLNDVVDLVVAFCVAIGHQIVS